VKRASDKLSFEKGWIMFQETNRLFQEMKKEDMFVSQWEKLIETLVEGKLRNLLQESGIDGLITSGELKVFIKANK